MFFSIIIPTYNRPDFLERSLNSVLSQTFQDFQVIIVNDGSVEGEIGYKKIEEKVEKNSNIKYIKKKNQGVSAARNLGMEKSDGQFVCFLDDDDYYLDNHLLELYNLIERNQNQAGFYRTFTNFEKEKGVIEPQLFKEKEKTIHPIHHILNTMVTANNICLHSDIFKDFRFNEELKHAEDYEMWFRILLKFPYFESLVITTHYDLSNESMSSGNIENYFKYIASYDVIFSNNDLLTVISKEEQKEIYKKYISWIIGAYLKVPFQYKAYKKLKELIETRVGKGYYRKNQLRFIKAKLKNNK